MEENKDYLNLVTKHIEIDKILSTSNPKYHPQIKKLLEKKDIIKKKNGLLAGMQINKINKKIEKLKNKK